ncbi:hypothetical protein AC1031_021446 [Aphanomyces cochlioides]|nr:hypothetical protein AC1031_021446 [Aphanomyces cochlioides]
MTPTPATTHTISQSPSRSDCQDASSGVYSTPSWTPGSQSQTRCSPYPQRHRTPTQSHTPPTRPSRRNNRAEQRDSQRYQLLVKPLLKATVGQRDTSGITLDARVVSGSCFNDILQKLWDEFKSNVKGRAVKSDDGWAVEAADIANWERLMQFKINKKVVDCSKTEQEWSQWLVKMKDKYVTLVMYEYGCMIGRQQELDEFTTACIRPLLTDRSGATAETTLRDIVSSLQTQWSATFQAEQVVWRMWANHISRNLNRSTWDAAITSHPPPHIVQLFQPVDSRLSNHLSNLRRSANMALDSVEASIADIQQLRQHIDIFESNLNTRKSIVEAFIRDIPPPPAHSVIDPLTQMENAEDNEHEDIPFN